MKILKYLEGKKTNIIGICGLIFGAYTNNIEIIIISLGLLGIRDAIRTK